MTAHSAFPGLSRRALLAVLAALPSLSGVGFSGGARAQDAKPQGVLPSWNDGPAKKAIVDFVRATTDKASPAHVPPEQRIAVFDQDGTLWVEHPIYSQVGVLPRPRSRRRCEKAGTQARRTVQDGALERSRGNREVHAT